MRRTTARSCTRALMLATCVLLGGSAVTAQSVPYSVPAEPWPEALGNHRAVIQVADAGDAVRAHLEWRRRDRDPETKRVLVTTAADEAIPNAVALNVTRIAADIVFQPTAGPGEYHVYYLPYTVQAMWGGYYGDYLKPEDTADAAWRARVGLDGDAWAGLPAAEVTAFQARTEFNRFDPMEIVATDEEVAALRDRRPDRDYLIFPEPASRPIWMFDDLPVSWTDRGPSDALQAEASRGQFLVFQLGVWAARKGLENVDVRFSDLRGPDGATIPAERFRCFNLGGTEWTGEPLVKTVSVPEGGVGSLWCGVDVPTDARPGDYAATVTVAPANAAETTVQVLLDVDEAVVTDHGESDIRSFARLRWLDSTIAQDDSLVAPYTPMIVEGQTVGCLGRDLTVGPNGLPESIRAGDIELLDAPAALAVTGAEGAAEWSWSPARFTTRNDGAVEWEVTGESGSLTMTTRARMEFDGHVTFATDLTASRDTHIDDVALDLPFRAEAVPYLMGIGHDGGKRPATHDWKWGAEIYQDSFWMGDVHAGVQCELRGASYCGPMVNLYWRLGQLQPPDSWNNGGKGGCTVREVPGDRVDATAYSGSRDLKAGETVTFEFALLLTPVKPLDTASHFRERYYHSYEPLDDIQARGGNIVNIHHGGELNPYINYPYLATEKLSAYVRDAHERDMRVKIYYTLREMTNHTVETPALRALGHEVIAPGSGGGYPWLREHLGSDYSPAWYQPFEDGVPCAAIVNSGASRWYNYYLEGLNWLARNVEIDGLYMDDVSFDRRILKRVRKILKGSRPDSQIDLHSNTLFSFGPANQYMEFFPYIDRLWFGEGFDYDRSPDYWLTEISGIPYGLMGDMLQNGGNPWRGMIYGMTARVPWGDSAEPLWKLWDAFGIAEARMVGYWENDCPVSTGRDDILATAYVREGATLLSVASWATENQGVSLTIDWEALGLDPDRAVLYAPPLKDFQEEALFRPGDPIPVPSARGWLLIVDETPREAVAGPAPASEPELRVVLDESFTGAALPDGWTKHATSPDATVTTGPDGAVLGAEAHESLYVESALPPGTRSVEVHINTGSDGGATWGPGLAIVWPHGTVRLYARPAEGRMGVDQDWCQWLYPSLADENGNLWFRLDLDDHLVRLAASPDGNRWTLLKTFLRTGFPDDPVALRVGKMSQACSTASAGLPAPAGACRIVRVRARAAG